jgi:V/A-type H+-transporting ATPase subunit D
MAMDEAIVEIGPSAVDAATLAQPIVATVERRVTSVAGVRMPRLSAAAASFRPQYGMGGTAATLDVAGSRMSQLVRALVSLADIEAAVAFLEAGLAQTIRRLRALDQIVIPNLERERRAVAAAIEEEERDEALRRKLWLETQPPPIPGLFASGARSPSAISHG